MRLLRFLGRCAALGLVAAPSAHAQSATTALRIVKTTAAGSVSVYTSVNPPYSASNVVYGTRSVYFPTAPRDAEPSAGGAVTVLLAETGMDSLVVVRYTAAGTLDATFGTGGRRRVAPGSTQLSEDTAGRLVVTGDRGLARFTPSGTPDASFAGASACGTATPTDGLLLAGDGLVVLCAQPSASFVTRLTSDGAPDPSFGANGRAAVEGDGGGVVRLDGAGIVRVVTSTAPPSGVSTQCIFTALDPSGRSLRAPTRLDQCPIGNRTGRYLVVFDNGTTWFTSTYLGQLGMRGVSPEGRPFGPWQVAGPIDAGSRGPVSASAGPLVRIGPATAVQHYGYLTGLSQYFWSAYSRQMSLAEYPYDLTPPVHVSPLSGPQPVPSATLTWRAVPEATGGYEVLLSSFDRGSPIPETGTTYASPDTTLRVPISTSSFKVYAWRVRSRDAAGRVSLWSLPSTFNAVLPSVALVTRYRGAETASQVLLQWTPIPRNGLDPLGYDVEVSKFRSFAVLEVDQFVRDNVASITTPPLGPGLHYWRVRAEAFSVPSNGLFEEVDSFVVSSGLLVKPEGPVGGRVTLPVTLAWAAAAPATSYGWQVSAADDFAVIADSGRTTTLRASPSLRGGAYYWRVRAHTATETGPFSPAVSFTAAPAAPALRSPLSGDQVSPLVTFAWADVPGAERYRVQVSNASGVTVLDTTAMAPRSGLTVRLPSQRALLGRVGAVSGTETAWSPQIGFTTTAAVDADTLPGADTEVTLTSPTRGDLVGRVRTSVPLGYELVNLLGAVVARGSVEAGAQRLVVPRGGLPAGVYVLRLQGEGVPAFFRRVVLL